MALIDINITVNPQQIQEMRAQLQTPEVQALRSAAMATPEGQHFKQQLDRAFDQEAGKLQAQSVAAVDEAKGLLRNAGVPESTIDRAFQPMGQNAGVDPGVQAEIMAASGGKSGSWMDSAQQLAAEKNDAGTDYMLQHAQKTEPLTSANATAEDQAVLSNLSYVNKFAVAAEKSNVSLGVNADQDAVNGYYAYQKACSLDSTGGEEVTVGEYCQNILNTAKEHNITLNESDKAFLEEMAKSERYKDLVIDHSDSCNVGNVSTQLLVVRNKDENHAFVAVQGTDCTTQDWITDAKFAGSEPTDEEKWLIERVNRYTGDYDSIDLSGHSQGGREAITISAMMDDPDKVRYVVSLDGPGYSKEFLEKYGHLIDTEKILHVYPDESIVGHILHSPGGEVIYVEANSSLISNHSMSTWRVDENGNFVQMNDANLISKITRAGTEYLSSKLSPDVLEETLPYIIRLTADPNDANKMDFSNIAKNLDTISFGDANMYLATGLVLVCDGYVDFYEKVSPYIDFAKNVCTVLSLIPWPGAGVCAAIASFLESLDGILSAIENVAKVISAICEWYLEYKARKLKEERQNYLNSNPSMRVNLDALTEAYRHLEAANLALARADRAYDQMWNFFEADKVETGNFILDGITYLYRVVTEFLSPYQAVKRLGNALLDLFVLQESSHVEKGKQAVDRAVANARKLSGSICGREDKEFFIHPQHLTFRADQAEKAIKQIKTNTEEAQAAVTEAGSIWQADDYTSINTFTTQNMEGVTEALNGLESMCSTLRDIAAAYSNYQKGCVEDFQWAKN
ncbi:MAG: DUF2974 domain-containing protein [Clostridia bacterium]|nr:DUF2974 domain-containing protein [Clostridia bacterium]